MGIIGTMIAMLFGISRSKAAIPPQSSGGGGGALVVTVEPTRENRDIDTLARTIWGEARGEGYDGMQAVANVIMNRYRAGQRSEAKARQFGRTIEEVCTKPYQFSAWNANDPNRPRLLTVGMENAQFRTAHEIATRAVRGNLPDITNGADHYHTNAVAPFWSQGQTPIASYGSHVFFRLA